MSQKTGMELQRHACSLKMLESSIVLSTSTDFLNVAELLRNWAYYYKYHQDSGEALELEWFQLSAGK